MDPSSAAATCNRKKRKDVSPAEDESKRFKASQESEAMPESGSSPCSPSITVKQHRLQEPITQDDLMELLRYAALGKAGGVKQPSWCRLRHQKKIKAMNVAIVEGVTQSHFYKHYLTLQHLRTTYTSRVTFTSPSADLASGIFSSEVPESDSLSQRHKEGSPMYRALMSHPVITRFGTQRRGLTAYVLTQEEMIKKRYPVKGMPGFEEFICTDSVDCVTDSSPLYGIDCEMCLTEKGYELARVSVVDAGGNCMLDQLVKPHNRILNYLTRFSGITAAMLRPITTTLRDVQAKLRTVLPSDAVLVGHSLDNDLKALKVIHMHIIDTSLLYRKDFGQKFKLKVLAETVLKKQIQTEEKNGHNPTEDALAALELAQYFIKTGPRQVVERHLQELWGYAVTEESADCPPTPVLSHRFADILQSLGRSVVFYGKRSDVALDPSNQLWHSSDKEVLASFRKQTKRPFLSVLQFSSYSDQLKSPPPPQEQRYPRLCVGLRDMCVVFAGPFPAAFSERDVRRVFRCCGPIHKVQMLTSAVRVHAEITFKLLEGAVLARRTLNGLSIQRQPIKVTLFILSVGAFLHRCIPNMHLFQVQRPVCGSTLDLDVTLDALMIDGLTASNVYAVKLDASVAESVNVPPKINGHPHAAVDAARPQLAAGKAQMSEKEVKEVFSRFGPVERVVLLAKPGRRATHAYIAFETSEDKQAALSSSEALWKHDYLICPALTPPHLPSWVAMTTPNAAADNEERTQAYDASQEMDLLRKMDRRLEKLFRSLPDDTLSVVVLVGCTSAPHPIPGLCLMEVKQRFLRTATWERRAPPTRLSRPVIPDHDTKLEPLI
ncbi:RNA exonuclease 5-like isoform X2 [Antennarius striatus]|uniref:RNA exonuclease 5-like isoform X2 n=1 Tax=Antennarius striatus TaxID=241820 RepID=UPI0035B36A16